MVKKSKNQQKRKPQMFGDLSGIIGDKVSKEEHSLSDEEKIKLDLWMNDFKSKRFGKQGYDSWLSEHTAD